jgi:uncharacterized protein (TIGR03083 family)
MNTLASRTIDALRDEHDALVALVATLSEDQLSGPSGAGEWSVAQVLSHLGSGSEITLANLRVGLGEREALKDDFNRSVWDRWDGMSPSDQRDGYIESNGTLVDALEALTAEQLAEVQVPIGFVPAPMSVASYAGMRLGEVAHHTWDVRVAVDPAARLLPVSTAILPEHLSGSLGFMLGFWGKADRVADHVVLAIDKTGYAISIGDTVTLSQEGTTEATATFAGEMEAALRLISGRLTPAHTPADVVVTGNVTLEQLRDVFPGY